MGTLFNAEEAHKIGLVDEIASNEQAAEAAADTQIQEFLNIPSINELTRG